MHLSPDYQDVVAFIRDFEVCCLPKAQWTHAEHLSESAWPLRFFSKERLFSVEDRRRWIEPDLAPAP